MVKLLQTFPSIYRFCPNYI